MAENKYHFERLTPIDNMDLDVYEEAIDYVFNNPDVKNVAISGAWRRWQIVVKPAHR